jgi:hypothetical protein
MQKQAIFLFVYSYPSITGSTITNPKCSTPVPKMHTGITPSAVVANTSGPEVGVLYEATQHVAIETIVDHRFILAIIMQESGGCIRVPTSNGDVRNPGHMQDHTGGATCNSKIDPFQLQNPMTERHYLPNGP